MNFHEQGKEEIVSYASLLERGTAREQGAGFSGDSGGGKKDITIAQLDVFSFFFFFATREGLHFFSRAKKTHLRTYQAEQRDEGQHDRGPHRCTAALVVPSGIAELD